MAGLAVGSALAGSYEIRGDRLRTYAVLEAIVGVSGIALTYGLAGLSTILAVGMLLMKLRRKL